MRAATSISLLASAVLPVVLIAGRPAQAQEVAPEVAQAGAASGARAGWDLYLSGYAIHSRSTYDSKRLRKLNEKTWGAGLGRTWRDRRGNESSLYLMAIRDSRRQRQWMAGYAHQWLWPLKHTGLEAGIGLTAGIIRRQDWFNGRPFPALLPVASVGTERARLVATYVPHIPRGKGQGNVLLLQLKFKF